MTAPRRIVRLFLVAPLLAAAASCVESRWPLSDEKTSKIDERLIGSWKDDADDVWKVRKSKNAKNALEVKIPDPNVPDWMLAFTTTIKSKHYMSVRDTEEDTKPDAVKYDIYQYVFVDNNTVEMRGMEEEVIVKAIEEKKLGGKILVPKTETRPFFGLFGKAEVVEYRTPVITDSPEGIARYLKAHADECFPKDTDAKLTFKRER